MNGEQWTVNGRAETVEYGALNEIYVEPPMRTIRLGEIQSSASKGYR